MLEQKEHKLSKRITLYIVLGSFFLTNAIIAEVIGAKIFSLETLLGFDPLNFKILGETYNLDLPAGFILWPVVFICTDIINEYYGKDGVRKISVLTAAMISFMFFALYFTTTLPPSDFWMLMNNTDDQGNFFNPNYAISMVFTQGIGIIIGSLVAFLIGQLLDATFFQWIKKLTGGKMIWLRATGSTLLSQLFDSYIVIVIAFYLFSDKYTLAQVIGMATVGYIYKLSIAIILTPVIYLAHYIIDRYLGEELADKMMNESS